jgi:DNA-binding NarL/FixJ family response regulator
MMSLKEGPVGKKSIIIIDDEPLISTMIQEIFEEEDDIEITQSASEKEDFISKVVGHKFDAALIDISVGGHDGGIEILQILSSKGIHLPVMMLSAHNELDYALKCLKAGAKGYTSKNYICTQLADGLREILEGKFFISGDNGPYLLKQFQKN